MFQFVADDVSTDGLYKCPLRRPVILLIIIVFFQPFHFRDVIREHSDRYFVWVKPFLIQSDLSVENGLFRLKPKSSFLTQSKKGFFDSTFSTENSDWWIQSRNSFFSTGSTYVQWKEVRLSPFGPTARSSGSIGCGLL